MKFKSSLSSIGAASMEAAKTLGRVSAKGLKIAVPGIAVGTGIIVGSHAAAGLAMSTVTAPVIFIVINLWLLGMLIAMAMEMAKAERHNGVQYIW